MYPLSYSQDITIFFYIKDQGLRVAKGRPYVLNNPYPATHKAYLWAELFVPFKNLRNSLTDGGLKHPRFFICSLIVLSWIRG